MSRVSKKQTVRQRVRRREVAAAKVSRESPCGRKPAAIDSGDVTLTFLETDGQKGGKYRLRVTWPEVTDDADGFPTTVDRYIVHLQTSEDGSTWDSDYRRKVVEVKDGDTSSTAKAIFKGITRKRYYRVRVRAKDSKGCKSDLPASWSSSARAGGSDTVPSVGAITRTRVGPRRIEFNWDDVEHPNFDRYKVVILKADTESGTFSVVRTRYTRQSHIAVHVDDDDRTRWWKVRVRVQLDKNPDGTTDESGDTDSTADQATDLPAFNGNETPPLQAPQNASSAFNKSTRVHSAAWNSPDNLTGYLRTRIQTFGSVDGSEYLLLSTHNITSTTANAAQTWQRTWTVNEVATYLKARLTIQHIADNTGVKRDGAVWTSAPKDTRDGTVTPPGTTVAAPTSVAVEWNPAGNYGVRATWTDPSPTTNIAYLQLRFQGGTTSDGPWDVISDDITVNVPAANNYTYVTTTQERSLYRYYRVRIRSIASDPTVSADSDWVNATAVDSGLGGGTPPPALALPTVTIPSRTASPITGGVRFKIRLTGSSGLPNGSADQIQWVLRRSTNSGASWTDRPFDDTAPGSVHAQGVIPTNGATSGTSVTYSEQVDYFLDQDTSDQIYFQLYAKAQDTTNGVGTEWVKSGQFTLSAPTAPGQPLTGSGVWINAALQPYFRVVMAPAANDFRSDVSPPASSMGENDIGYYISWAVSTSTTAPTGGWTEVFRRTSSELGNGVEWDGTNYTFRVPAADRLPVTVNQNQYLWVKVRVRYIGDGGNDAGDNLRGSFSGYNTAERMPRMGAM